MYGGTTGGTSAGLTAEDTELVAGSPQERNWRGIGIALLTIMVMCALIILAVILLTPNTGGTALTGKPITLPELLSGNLSARSSGAKWVKDSTLVMHRNGSIVTVNVVGEQPHTSVLVDSAPFEQFAPVSSWQVSSSMKYIAFGHHPTKTYKHSSTAYYNIRDVNNPIYHPVKPNIFRNDKLQLFSWNPKPHAIDFVFVFENNIYYQKGPQDAPEQLTFSSNPHDYNGVPDWLYEEEIFGSNSALWWSKEGEYLAYASFNDTGVPQIQFPIYSSDSLYPNIKNIPYPKVGEPIPQVKLNIWKRQSDPKDTVILSLPAEITDLDDYYLLSVMWLNSEVPSLLAIWSNRAQNIVYFTVCSYDSTKCVMNVEQKFEKGHLSMYSDPNDLKSQYSTANSYFMILPEQRGHNVYNHVANISIPKGIAGATVQFLDSGEYDVTSIVAYDHDIDMVYYMAAGPLPRYRNLYRSGTRGSGSECMTCWMNDNGNCTYMDANFSPDAKHYILNCAGPSWPREYLVRVDNTTLMVLENNTDLGNRMQDIQMPTVVYKRIELPEAFQAEVKLLLPAGLKEGKREKPTPLILKVYAGPGTQEVADSWRVNYDTYLASNKGYIVAYVDGRGSGYKGWAYKSQIYRNLGTKEVADQLYALRSLVNDTLYIDPERIAVWGWSYGGFVSAMMAQQDKSNILRCAASIAPVTHFQYYDATYTERYMGLQEENPIGYANTNTMKNVTRMQRKDGKGVDYLLVHGTGDDNVHFQNSALMIKALTQANVQFELMIYTNEEHSISSGRAHLNTLLDKFFENCFV